MTSTTQPTTKDKTLPDPDQAQGKRPADSAQLFGQRLFSVFRVLRAPFTVSVLAFLIFAFLEQLHELYRIHAELVVVGGLGWQFAATAGVTVLMGFALWYVSRHLTDILLPAVKRKRSFIRQLLRWTPRFLGALPLFGIAVGLYLASPLRDFQDEYGDVAVSSSTVPEALRNVHQVMTYGSGLFVFLGVGLLLVTFFRTFGKKRSAARGHWMFQWWAHLVFFALLAGFVGLCVYYPVTLTQSAGTILIISLFVVFMAMLAAQLTYLSDRTGFPFIITLAITALVYTAFDVNDNHYVRGLNGVPQTAPVFVKDVLAPDLSQQFEKWIKARGDKDAFKDQTYPVYVVAAQGGGLYAAYHSASFLSRMQDLCPGFAQHVFAISGVSGGSLGGAIFSSLAKKIAVNGPHQKCRDAENVFSPTASSKTLFQTSTENILSSDFLSPLVFGTLFPDMLQRFIPYPMAELDRTQYLEKAFAQGWQGYNQNNKSPSAEDNPFEQDFLKLWTVDGAAPALMLNMTEAKSGLPWIISPFDLQGVRVRNFPLWEGDKYLRGLTKAKGRKIANRIQLPLGQAVSLSARAPGITPPASLIVQHDRYSAEKVQLVDGAFFDNSGVESAMGLIKKLDRLVPYLKRQYGINVKVNLIVLTSGTLTSRPVADDRSSTTFSPIAALNSTRTARSYYAIVEAQYQLDRRGVVAQNEQKNYTKVRLPRVRKVSFQKLYYQVPLGWHLSPVSRQAIKNQLGDYTKCPAPDENFENTNFIANGRVYLQNVNCVQRSIMHELNGDMPRILASLSEKRKETLATANAKRQEIMARMALAQKSKYFDRKMFFQCATGVFYKGRLTPSQKDGLGTLLDYYLGYPELYNNPRWLAYGMAISKGKTASVMQPVREALCDSNACAVDRITRNVRANKLAKNRAIPEIETGKNYYGRGHVQMSLVENYRNVGQTLGLGDALYVDPDLALDKHLSVYIMFEGMRQGLFRPGHQFATYFDGDTTDESNWTEALSIIQKVELRDKNYIRQTYGKWGQKFLACLKPAFVQSDETSAAMADKEDETKF